ncbi:MAG: FAD-dependent oxidoreductase [Candidatus Dojkabacteria bacterium]|nr:MAG: FAD-dependent oxidoreductase [Candidatus Dojkabacteria bacterium]
MKKVAVIGAGFTGLTAAYELSKKGFEVTVFEKSTDIGGLAGGFTLQGASLEKAYHHLFKSDTDILKLIAELGLREELKWFESKVGMIVREKDSSGQITSRTLPFNGVKDLLFYKPLSFFNRLRAGAVLFFLQKFTLWEMLIATPAATWMKKASGMQVMEKIWTPLLSGKFAHFAEKVSMAWLWARIHIRANSRTSIFEKELLAYPRNGFHSIAKKLAEQIAQLQNKKEQDVIKTTTTIEKIAYNDDGTAELYIDKKKHSFDAIVATIPAKAFSALIAPEAQQKLDLNKKVIDYLGAVVLVFTSSQSLSKFYWHTITDTTAPFLVFLQHTNLVPTSWYNGQQVYYIGVYIPHEHRYFSPEMTPEKIQKEWFSYVKQVFHEFDENKIAEAHLFKFPFAQHVVDTAYPEKILPYKLPLPHTYLANFSQIFPEDRGTNYAVREGKKIADLVAEELLQ